MLTERFGRRNMVGTFSRVFFTARRVDTNEPRPQIEQLRVNDDDGYSARE